MLYVGCDPGIVESAVVILDDSLEVVSVATVFDEWTGPASVRLAPGRLAHMTSRIIAAIETVGARNGSLTVAVEEPFVGANAGGALKQHSVWAALAWYYHGLIGERFLSVAPTTIKRYVGLKANKAKALVARQVYRRWKFENDDLNVVDAYAIARWAAERDG